MHFVSGGTGSASRPTRTPHGLQEHAKNLGLVFLFSERISTYLIEILVQDCCPDGVCCEVSSIPCFASCISLRNTSTNVSLRESLRFDDKQTNLPDLCFTKGEE